MAAPPLSIACPWLIHQLLEVSTSSSFLLPSGLVILLCADFFTVYLTGRDAASGPCTWWGSSDSHSWYSLPFVPVSSSPLAGFPAHLSSWGRRRSNLPVGGAWEGAPTPISRDYLGNMLVLSVLFTPPCCLPDAGSWWASLQPSSA